ncbi:MAG: penicillin-binding protein, partial [Pseudomonadota bacterium]|nr:penicillin-binding protein [Pseudomonadota bacterium]
AIDARNAFIMERLLQEVARSGTAARAQRDLKRPDLYGKTGTTNDSIDTWFNGFHQTLVAIVWMGYDTPRSLGDRETGGGLSLPVWINFMETALKGVPVMEPAAPQGVVNVGGEWYYEEYARGSGISSLGVGAGTGPGAMGPPEDKSLMNSDGMPPGRQALPPTDERKSILDLFRN